MSVKIIAEIGINHNGDLDIAKKLIDIAATAGCDYVKFQKRNPDLCVPDHQKRKRKNVPWRNKPTTYLQYKKDIEFSIEQYAELYIHCAERIKMFASVWDIDSAIDMANFCNVVKIPSAKLTDNKLLEKCRKMYNFRLLSTGMSTERKIEKAVKIFDPHVIFHTNSVYPTPVQDVNMLYINWLADKYPEKQIGFSSHCYGITPVVASTLLCDWIEFHITLNHDMWGSDQKSSIEPHGVFEIVKKIRDLEKAQTGYQKRRLYPGEEKKRSSLR